MKVIDFHLHIAPLGRFTPCAQDYFRDNNPGFCERFAGDITPEAVIEILQAQGVDRGIMLAEYAPDCSSVITNEYTAEFCRKHEELIPVGALCCYDDTPYVEQARYCVEELGMRGFKLLPSYQFFYPNDPAFFPFYEYVQSRGLFVMYHTGPSIFRNTRIKYADPLLLDDVANEFPELTMIMEHGGRPFWYDRAAWLISRHENMHIGIAGMPVRRLPEYFPRLEQYGNRFVFGSDWPGMADVKGQIKRVLALPVSEETKEMILHKNAERILARAR